MVALPHQAPSEQIPQVQYRNQPWGSLERYCTKTSEFLLNENLHRTRVIFSLSLPLPSVHPTAQSSVYALNLTTLRCAQAEALLPHICLPMHDVSSFGKIIDKQDNPDWTL